VLKSRKWAEQNSDSDHTAEYVRSDDERPQPPNFWQVQTDRAELEMKKLIREGMSEKEAHAQTLGKLGYEYVPSEDPMQDEDKDPWRMAEERKTKGKVAQLKERYEEHKQENNVQSRRQYFSGAVHRHTEYRQDAAQSREGGKGGRDGKGKGKESHYGKGKAPKAVLTRNTEAMEGEAPSPSGSPARPHPKREVSGERQERGRRTFRRRDSRSRSRSRS
jgi:hypothetical protein